STVTARVLTALRRAASGEKVAVLLDSDATAAVPGLPFAADLQVVARSRPLPAALLCSVGKRIPGAEADALVGGLGRLKEMEGGSEILSSLRLSRFRPLALAVDDASRASGAGTPAKKP